MSASHDVSVTQASSTVRSAGCGAGTSGRSTALHELTAVGIALAVTVIAVAAWAGALAVGVGLSVWLTPRPLPDGHPRLLGLPAGPRLDVEMAMHGRELYQTACALCHGSDGGGRTGLGVTLERSDFVADRDDDALVAFITAGRDANSPESTTRLPMPPKGGHDSLTQADLRAIVTHVRGLQDPRRRPDLPRYIPPAERPQSAAELASALAAAGGDEERAAWIASGTRLYAANCLACHGSGGAGIAGVGATLRDNAFIQSHADDEALLDFLLAGRMPSDPGSVLGLAMPAKGGNPALSEDDLLDIVAYLRTLQTKTD